MCCAKPFWTVLNPTLFSAAKSASHLKPSLVLESVTAFGTVEGVLVVVNALDVSLEVCVRLEGLRTPIAHEVALICTESNT